jgi:hypothetical protein
MSKLRFKRVPEFALFDLQDVDLRVLDFALTNLKDKIRLGQNKDHFLSDYEMEALDLLHTQVLMIKRGEESIEE